MPDFLTEDDLISQPQTGMLSEADLVAPVVKVKKKAPAKKPVKGPAGLTSSPMVGQFMDQHEMEVEQNPAQAILKMKPLTDLDYKKPMFELGQTEAGPTTIKAVKAKRGQGESMDEFLIREAQFSDRKKREEIVDKQKLAQIRAKIAPKKGTLGTIGTSFAQGYTEPIRQLVAAGERISGSGNEMFEPWNQQVMLNQEEVDSWKAKIAQGLGSTVPFVAASAAGGLPATALLGASTNAAQTYEDAIMRGADKQAAFEAAIPGAVIGSLEGLMGLGTGKFVQQLGKGTIKSLAGGIAEEELQELTSQTLNNANAKWLSGYDPQRAIHEGLWETFVTTLGTAGLIHGATIGGHQDASSKPLPSFSPTDLQAMERRSLEVGRPIALTPETAEGYKARTAELKQQLLTLDPTSPDFARLADEHTRLARAIEETPTTIPQSYEELRQHLVDTNMGHEGAADEMMEIIRREEKARPLEFDPEKFEAARASDVRGARFYPLDSNPEKGGTVYVTPKTMEEAGLAEVGQRSEIGALNVDLDVAMEAANSLAESQPDVAMAFGAAINEAESKGLPKISVVGYSEGQGLVETRRLMRHESFHTGQEAASRKAGVNFLDLHPRDIVYHESFNKAARSEVGQNVLKYYNGNADALAMEMAAYTAAGQGDYLDLSPAESAAYLTDYLTGIADEHGADALDALAGTARLAPKIASQIKEISNESKPKNFGQANRDFAASLRAEPSASLRSAGPQGRGEAGSDVDAGRTAEGINQVETGGVAGGPPTGERSGTDPNGAPNIFTTVLTSDAVKEIAGKAEQVLQKLGLPNNPLIPPHEQIMLALKEHPDVVTPAAVAQAMKELNLDMPDIIKAVDDASAHAGRLLRNLQDANAKWDRAIRENPEWAIETAKTGVHAFGLGPSPKEVLKEGVRNLEATELGRTWWQRGGDMYRKMLLTRFSTAANNAISTIPRLPLDLFDGLMTGSVMGAINPEKYAGKSDATIAEGAKAGAIAGAQTSMRVALAFPEMAKKLFRQATPETDLNNMVISQMENLHPELHNKLTGLSTDIKNLETSKAKIEDLRSLLPYLNDAEKQKEYGAKLDLLAKRQRANESALGKAFNKTGWIYDKFLAPSTMQEFFFRRPYFVGALVKHARDAGFDLYEMAKNSQAVADFAKDPTSADPAAIMNLKTFGDLPRQVWENAADDALTFTYAYAPKDNRGGVEFLYSKWIEGINRLGFAGALVDAFPKATYNGLKFAYEYSPLGMVKPFINMGKDAYEGGKENIQYNDVSRVSKAVLGTAMFAVAIGIRKELGGEEWYQIKSGKKDKKGQPIYLNVKKYMPFAGMLYLADVALRFGKRDTDKKYADELSEIYLNSRRADSSGAAFFDTAKAMYDYWNLGAEPSDKAKSAVGRPVGNILSAPLTPIINLRDLVAQFDEDEAARRDMKGSPILGPSIDRIPWLRSNEKYGLPLYQPPTEEAPRPSSFASALTEVGISLDPGSNFATREFARLGLSPIRWLKPDPDPKINRAQYAAYAKRLAVIAPKIEASPLYQSKTDAQKAAFWEAKLGGPDGLAAEAKELGQQANPKEINRREILQSQPPLQRKATGLDKKVQEIKNKTVP